MKWGRRMDMVDARSPHGGLDSQGMGSAQSISLSVSKSGCLPVDCQNSEDFFTPKSEDYYPQTVTSFACITLPANQIT
ncbi:hypothetical protein TNCV_2694851 [Trichonephila clavipes]|nr:hypothetical protein TNCV_2694851 [Trichonephila clavipes]